MLAVRIAYYVFVLLTVFATLSSIASGVAILFDVQAARLTLACSLLALFVPLMLAVWWFRASVRGPLFSLASEEQLVLEGPTGVDGTWRSSRWIVARSSNITSMRTVLDSTGKIPQSEAYFDGRPIDIHIDETHASERRAHFYFGAVLKPLVPRRLHSKVVLKSTFDNPEGEPERFFWAIYHPAVRLTLLVHFPKERPPLNCWLRIDDGAKIIAGRNASKSRSSTTDGDLLTWTIWRAVPGQVYRVYWTWNRPSLEEIHAEKEGSKEKESGEEEICKEEGG